MLSVACIIVAYLFGAGGGGGSFSVLFGTRSTVSLLAIAEACS